MTWQPRQSRVAITKQDSRSQAAKHPLPHLQFRVNAVLTQENVFRLQVTMDVALVVDVFQRQQYTAQDA